MATIDQAGWAVLAAQEIELPSWAFGSSGTRFKVFASPGTPRSVHEKLADAAQVHRFTGLAPSVALHIPWDHVPDYGALVREAEDLGLCLGTVNSNTFQDEDYKLGSLAHADARVRRKAVDHHLECLDVMAATGSQDLKFNEDKLVASRNFANNWDLSLQRARTVLEKLIELGIPEKQLSAAGHADTHPVADNDTEEGRQLNRRIEIVLMPNLDELPDLSALDDSSN